MPEDGRTRDVSRYYDDIYRWSQLTSRFRALSGAGAHTIHRILLDDETSEASPHTIHRLIAQSLDAGRAIDALDAGCGYGGTCLDLHERVGGRWHGITINKTQIAVARRSAKAMGKADAVTFELASYDRPPGRSFNLIYGIESLIHSADPGATIANLCAHLGKDGLFIIVDDMPVEPFPPALAPSLAAFQTMWRCPVMPNLAGWSRYLEEAGCRIEAVRDLTPQMRPRSGDEVDRELRHVARRRRWRDRIGLRMVGDAQTGGLELERLGHARAVLYTMIVARKI